MELLERVKLFLGIKGTEADDLISELINVTQGQLKVILGTVELPEETEFIIHDLVITRFNRLGSEGMDSESVEGHSVSYSKDDFTPYASFLAKLMPDEDDKSDVGEVLFY